MSPVGKGESLSPYVARLVPIVEASGLPHELHAMGTIVEGEWDEVMGLLKRCYEALRSDCPRISVTIKLDIREGARDRLRGKVESVRRRLGRGTP